MSSTPNARGFTELTVLSKEFTIPREMVGHMQKTWPQTSGVPFVNCADVSANAVTA